MSLFVLATGTLINDPHTRSSSKGSAYVTATLRTPVEDSDAVLMAYAKGDSIAATLVQALQSMVAQNKAQTAERVVETLDAKA